MTQTHDVIIIGGGPSGLHSARKLAKEGLDVLVLEKKEEIGKNIICAGIVGREIFEEFSLEKDSILTEIQKVKMISPQGATLIYRHPAPLACVVDRGKFDKNLANAAWSSGVSIELENQAVDITIDKNYVEVFSRAGDGYLKNYRAKVAIFATGIDNHFNKKLCLGYPVDYLKGAQVELEVSEIDMPTILIGKQIAPGAFAWIVPTNGNKARIGLITKRDTEKDPRLYLEILLKKLYPVEAEAIGESQVQSRVIAQGLLTKTFTDRVLVLGEAAGQVKTTTGGGIFFGLTCAEIAAKVLLKRFKEGIFKEKQLSEYEILWKKAIQKEILIGYNMRKIYARLSDQQIERLFQIAKNDGIIPIIEERGRFDWHGDLIVTLAKRLPIRSLQRILFLHSELTDSDYFPTSWNERK